MVVLVSDGEPKSASFLPIVPIPHYADPLALPDSLVQMNTNFVVRKIAVFHLAAIVMLDDNFAPAVFVFDYFDYFPVSCCSDAEVSRGIRPPKADKRNLPKRTLVFFP